MKDEYDGIIIGAGHNGLISAGYLARAGLRVLLIERHLEIGGGLDAHEGARSGFWHNVHSVNHRGVSDLMWYRDLQLTEMGQEYLQLPVTVAMLGRDGRALLWYAAEPERTASSIARYSAKDARAYLERHAEFAEMAREIFFVEQYSPPLPFEEKRALLQKSRAGRRYLEWQPYSINEAVSRMFENDAVRGMFAFLSVVRGFEVDSRGMGMVAAAAIGSGVQAQMSRGTSHKLAHSLHKMVVRAGVDLVESDPAARILTRDGRAAGVRTASGREFFARKFVMSGLNPQQTFLDLLEKKHVPAQFAARVERFKYSNTTPLFTLHLALREPLRWKAAESEPDVDKAFYLIAGLEGLGDIVSLYEDAQRGRLPRALQLIGAQPSVHDPSQAPPGQSTAFFWQVAPGELCAEEGGRERWDSIREVFSARCLAHLGQYATNLTPANIVSRFGLTPLDIERHLPNMRGGDIQVGEVSEAQFLDRRPFPECSQYRTPVPGLYLCGSSTHPGGNITGAPGYNAAGIVCRDLGIDPWWRPVDAATHWRNLAHREAGPPGDAEQAER